LIAMRARHARQLDLRLSCGCGKRYDNVAITRFPLVLNCHDNFAIHRLEQHLIQNRGRRSMFKTIGVIAGVDAEAAALFPGQSANVEALHGFMVRQVQFADRNIAITCSGIGKVNAA
jgi:hypothetical protein